MEKKMTFRTPPIRPCFFSSCTSFIFLCASMPSEHIVEGKLFFVCFFRHGFPVFVVVQITHYGGFIGVQNCCSVSIQVFWEYYFLGSRKMNSKQFKISFGITNLEYTTRKFAITEYIIQNWHIIIIDLI